MNKMTASNIWFSGKLCKAQNKQKRGLDFPYEYNVKDPGFRSIQQVAVVCSVANFDRSLPADKISAVQNDETLTKPQKEEKIKELEIDWQQKLKNMMYLDMPTTGDASESGLIKFFQPIEDITSIRQQFPVVRDAGNRECRIPFNSDNKYAYSVNHYEKEDSYYCVFVKGAPERVWKLCNYLDVEGKPVPKSAEWERKFLEANNSFGKNG